MAPLVISNLRLYVSAIPIIRWEWPLNCEANMLAHPIQIRSSFGGIKWKLPPLIFSW